MFLFFNLLFLFIAGLPISFGIGSLIGYFVWKICKKKQTKRAKFYVLWGGLLYIISQPISFLVIVFLPVRKLDDLSGYNYIPFEGSPTPWEMYIAVLFALLFTTGILILMAEIQKTKTRKKQLSRQTTV